MQVSSSQNTYGETYRLIVNGKNLRRLKSGAFEAEYAEVSGVELKSLPKGVRIAIIHPDDHPVYAGGLESVNDTKALMTVYYDKCPAQLKSGISYLAHVKAAERMINSKIAGGSDAQLDDVFRVEASDHIAIEYSIEVDAVDVAEACNKAVEWFADIEAKLADLSHEVDNVIHQIAP